MNRAWSLALVFCSSVLLLAMIQAVTQATNVASRPDLSTSSDLTDLCYFNSFTFGVDDWIESAPSNTILAEITTPTRTYPALVATRYGLGKAVYAPGSLFSEINNLVSPHNPRMEIFLNSVKWVTNNRAPTQTTILVTYGHRELVTYGIQDKCCTTNIVQALENLNYTVDITSDIPLTLTGYSAVIMPGVGWYLSPGYPNPVYWSGDLGHAPTPAEVASLLDFVQNGGGLVASVEYKYGADWMGPIGGPMSVTFRSITETANLVGIRIADHFILAKPCTHVYLPVIHH